MLLFTLPCAELIRCVLGVRCGARVLGAVRRRSIRLKYLAARGKVLALICCITAWCHCCQRHFADTGHGYAWKRETRSTVLTLHPVYPLPRGAGAGSGFDLRAWVPWPAATAGGCHSGAPLLRWYWWRWGRWCWWCRRGLGLCGGIGAEQEQQRVVQPHFHCYPASARCPPRSRWPATCP